MSNDNVQNAANASNTVVNPDTNKQPNTVYSQLEQLIVQREVWESTALAASNDRLYSILQTCYTIYVSAGSKETAATLREALELHARLKNMKFLSSTHTLTKIVKCVFGNDRRRASAYSIALRKAHADRVLPLNLPDYIRKAGGVEELRLAKSPTALTTAQKAAAVEGVVANDNLGAMRSEALSHQLDMGNVGKRVLLVATQEADGQMSVHAVINNDTLVKLAMAALYAKRKSELEAKTAEKSAANDGQQTAALINAAVASVQAA